MDKIIKQELSNTVNTTGEIYKSMAGNSAKYIKGYYNQTATGAISDAAISATDKLLGTDIKSAFGISDSKTDSYDPYHLNDSKKENFWYLDNNGQDKSVGRDIQKKYDDDTNTFKRSLYSEYGFRGSDFWYEDPLIPSFELFFDEETPFFSNTKSQNSLLSFIDKYQTIDTLGYTRRYNLLTEFKKVFWKIFENSSQSNSNRNISNKAYYVTKVAGLNNLNKKMIKYGDDKITITLNEDVSMIAWYLVELYNNITYSYKNQRHMFPENVLRFNMNIKINDIRNFTIPQNKAQASDTTAINKNLLTNNIKNVISPKSSIMYTLHDCNFNFNDSRNYGDEIEIGGYGANTNTTPATLSFDIYYKSVSRVSNFPLIENSMTIQPYEDSFSQYNTATDYYNDLDRIQSEKVSDGKGYLNGLLTKAKSTVSNIGINYMKNLETKLREARGTAVNGLLNQFRDLTTINKIEPDNVYNSDFNNRTSVKNLGRQLASGLINDLENEAKKALFQ